MTGKGILKLQDSEHKFMLTRHLPSANLSEFVKHYWIIRWDLGDTPPYTQTVLSHPNVNMVLENGKAGVYGVAKTVSTHTLKGHGAVFGVKFMSGGFYPFWQRPVSQLTGKSLSASDVFGHDMISLAADIHRLLASNEDLEAVERMNEYLLGKLPASHTQGEFVNEIVDLIQRCQQLTRVDEVAKRVNVSVRTLQRLFRCFIGVSPKWVIQRYRLHEVAERIDRGENFDWTTFALELGYYDQAHFIREFKAIIGQTPEKYASI